MAGIAALGDPALAKKAVFSIDITQSTNGNYDADVNQAIKAGANASSEVDGFLTRDSDWQDYEKFYVAA